jgi:hypothetical protein
VRQRGAEDQGQEGQGIAFHPRSSLPLV